MKLKSTVILLFVTHIPLACSFSIEPISCGDRLNIDHAQVMLSILFPNTSLYAVNEECFKCSDSVVAHYSNSSSPTCVSMLSPHKWTLKLKSTDNVVVFNLDYSFGDQGNYYIDIFPNKTFRVQEIAAPADSTTPLIILFCIIVIVVGVSLFSGPCTARLCSSYYDVGKQKIEAESSLGHSLSEGLLSGPCLPNSQSGTRESSDKTKERGQMKRLQSLDAVRGFSLYLMIFVNYGCGGIILIRNILLLKYF